MFQMMRACLLNIFPLNWNAYFRWRLGENQEANLTHLLVSGRYIGIAKASFSWQFPGHPKNQLSTCRICSFIQTTLRGKPMKRWFCAQQIPTRKSHIP